MKRDCPALPHSAAPRRRPARSASPAEPAPPLASLPSTPNTTQTTTRTKRVVSTGSAVQATAAASTPATPHAAPVQLMLDMVVNAFVDIDGRGRVADANARAARLFEQTLVPGVALATLLPWLPGSALAQRLADAASSGDEQSFVLREPQRGAWWQCRALPHAAGVSLYLRDITAQRRAGLAGHVFRLGLEQMHAGVLVCVCDPATAQVTIEFANPQAQAWLGTGLDGLPLEAVLTRALQADTANTPDTPDTHNTPSTPDWPPQLAGRSTPLHLHASLRQASPQGPGSSTVLALACHPVHEDDSGGASHWLVTLLDRSQAQADAQRRFELDAVFAHGDEGVLLLDARQLSLRQANPRFCALAGQTLATLAALDSAQWLALLQPERPAGSQATLCEGQTERPVQQADGSWRLVAQRVALVRDAAGAPRLWVCNWIDRSQQRDAASEIERLRLYDPLTGLLNRHGLRARAAALFGQVHAEGGHCLLLSLDLGNLNEINQHQGMAAGDLALVALATSLAAAGGSDGVAARLGSSRFALLLRVPPGDDPLAHADLVAAAWQADTGGTLAPRVASGLALFPNDAPDFDNLLLCSELALAGGRKRGDGVLYRYTLADLDRSRTRFRLLDALQGALQRGEFELHYQPQVRPQDGRVLGVEALLRWRHPVWGMVSPAQFIPLAEESGLIHALGRWVLETACLQARRWSAGGPLTVAVNFSPLQITAPDILAQVEHALQASGLPGAQLEIEITEGLLLDGGSHVEAVMGGLKALGVQLVLDDFGTGYASLGYLQRLPLDVLKIDRSFVQGVVDQPRQRAITEAVIAVGRALGLRLVAEGVETLPQLQWLQARGCELAQGYLYSRPLPAATLDSLLFARRTLLPAAAAGLAD